MTESIRISARAGTAAKAIYFSILLMTTILAGCSLKMHRDNLTDVTISGERWLINGEPVLKGTPSEGLLVNVRMVNAVFDDEGPEAKYHLPQDFDAASNTTRFIAQIPDYYAHGVRGFTVSLQGGMPGYEGAVNSAFNADGSLREAYLGRVARVIRAADQQGGIVILSCFYQRQHSHRFALSGKKAIFNAAGNVARWIVRERFSNVVMEISNEYAHGGYRQWKDGEWLRSIEGQVELIRHVKGIAPDLLVSSSGMGSGVCPPAIAEAADFILLHLNRTAVDLIPERARQARSYGKPVLCNEDDKTGRIGAESARVCIKSGIGWGFMHAKQNQSVPFEFEGAKDDTIVYAMLDRLTRPGGSIDDLSGNPLFVLVTSPIDGDVFSYGNSIQLRATITGVEDLDGISVHFVAEGKEIGQRRAAPWEIEWKNPPPGKYNVIATVKDRAGAELLHSGMVDFEVRR